MHSRSQIKKPTYRALVCSLLAVLLVPMICCSVFFLNAINTLKTEATHSMEASLRLYCQNMDNYLGHLNRISQELMLDKTISAALKAEESLNAQDRLAIKRIRDNLSIYKSSGDYIEQIYLYSNTGKLAVTNQAMYSEDYLYRFIYSPAGIDISDMRGLHTARAYGTLTPLCVNGEAAGRIAYVRSLDYAVTAMPETQLVMLLDGAFFRAVLDESSMEIGTFFVQNDKGELLLVLDRQGGYTQQRLNDSIAAFKSAENGRIADFSSQQLLGMRNSEHNAYRVGFLLPKSVIADRVWPARLGLILSLVMMASLGGALVFLLAHTNYRPIARMMERVHGSLEQFNGDENDLKAIENGLNEIVAQYRQTQKKMSRQQQALRSQVLARLLDGGTVKDSQPVFEELSAQLAAEPYVLAVLSGEGEWLEVELDKIRGEWHGVWTAAVNGGAVLLISSETMDEEEAELTTEEILDGMEEGFDYRAAISTVHRGIKELTAAYHEADLVMESALTGGQGTVVRYDKDNALPRKDDYDLEAVKRLAYAISAGEWETAEQSVERLTLETEHGSMLMRKLQFSALQYALLHHLPVIKALQEPNAFAAFQQAVLSAGSRGELRPVLLGLMRREGEEEGLPKIDAEAVDIVLKQYGDSQLNVAGIARQMNLSPNYLSRTFKRIRGEGLLSYIHGVRIEQAKRILRESPGKTIDEIASLVGYADRLTLIRSFKRREGVTPGQYREEARKA